MTLEDQVTNLELSKKLKDLGVEQESLFYWVEQYAVVGSQSNYQKGVQKDLPTGTGAISTGYTLMSSEEVKKYQIKDGISAFTVAELGEMLPDEINIPFKNGRKRKHSSYLIMKKRYCRYFTNRWHGIDSGNADSEANARAKMVVYLIENKLLATKDVSTRRREGK